MKLSKIVSPSVLSSAFSVIIPVVIIACVIVLMRGKDTQEIAPPTSQTESSLSAGDSSREYTLEEAFRIFKSGDQEAINKVVMSRKRVIWDGKSEFENGVQYRIPKDLIKKARNMNENFRRLNDMDRTFQMTASVDSTTWIIHFNGEKPR